MMSAHEPPSGTSTELQRFTFQNPPNAMAVSNTVKPTTDFGVFPPEIWMVIRDILEKKDDRATLAPLARCNSKFADLMHSHLYKRFITKIPGTDRNRSFTGFTAAVSKSPRLASFVKIVKIDITDPEEDFFVEPIGNTPICLVNMDPQLAMQLYTSINGDEGSISQLTVAIMEALPTLLPNLMELHTHSGIIYEDASPWRSSHVRFWAERHPNNRLLSLKDVTVTHRPKYHYTPFLIVAQWCLVAPNLQSITMRIISADDEEDPDIRIHRWKDFQMVSWETSLSATLNNLRYLNFECEEPGEAVEIFHFLWHFRKLDRVDLRIVPSDLLDEDGVRGYCLMLSNHLWVSREPWLKAAVSPAIMPTTPPSGYLLGELFTLKYQTNIKFMKVGQDMLMLAAMIRGGQGSASDRESKMLVNFLPRSLETLCIMDVDRKCISAIRLLTEDVLRGCYPELQNFAVAAISKSTGRAPTDEEMMQIQRYVRRTKLKIIMVRLTD
ncbi:hypothetical protein F4805DRAFT_160691 [Annulohypoxylon moriforme]|nr:hypothetical protein F4805DRAFT_160691 [Annulohypoxylon moriforme]